jgi:hypothetical protein
MIMAYAKIENNIVVFKSKQRDETLTEIPDNVCCGMIKNEDGTFSNSPKKFDDEMVKLRDKRNGLLKETDWMGNSDLTMSEKWKTYRQNLRDITNGLTTVANIEAVTWPKKPK